MHICPVSPTSTSFTLCLGSDVMTACLSTKGMRRIAIVLLVVFIAAIAFSQDPANEEVDEDADPSADGNVDPNVTPNAAHGNGGPSGNAENEDGNK
uniref:Secreted protein n=1 Tax=Steinernema glaseri TaxID=37863 RepID=A0A1I7ZKJ3_9BILA